MEKTVLEVEPGAATDQQAQPHQSPPPSGKGDGRKSLLGDAEKLKELRYNTSKVERHLKQLVKSGEELQKAREELYVKEQQWVMDMVDFNLHHDVRSDKHPANVKGLARQMYYLNKEVQEGVMQPMKQFLQVEVNGSVEMQKKLDMARDRYQTASTKFSGVSHKTDMTHFTKWENEVAESKQEYDLIYFNGMTKMMEVERNKIHLIHSLFYHFYVTYQRFFDTTGQTFDSIMPEMLLWKEAIDEGRKRAREQAAENDDIMMDHVSKLQQSGFKSREALELKSPRVNMLGNPVEPDRQGYLFKKIPKKGKGWKCSWFVLERGILMYYKNIRREVPDGGLNLLLCTVKEVPEKHLCFQVISTDDQFNLRATNETEYAEWVSALRSGIASQLAGGEDSSDPRRVPSASKSSLVQELWPIEGNSKCADCGQKDPYWAVLNWGVLICVKCSGTHRSLGVHISKVRSLDLDKWEPQQLGLMKSIGNALSNTLWEADVPEEWAAQRPEPESDGKTKERWIKTKYVDKAFIHRANLSPNELGQNLRDAVLAKDYTGVLKSILLGVDINWADPEDSSRTAIHVLPFSGGTAAMLEFLLQNGGEVNAEDASKRTPLHYAVGSERPDLCKIMRSRGASLAKVDAEGRTPLELAESLKYEGCAAVLKDERKESIGVEPLTPKNSFTGMGSAAAASGASPPEDISKALRGSLNLLSSGFSGSPGPSRREVKERDRFQRTTTPPGKLNKPRLITMIKDQVIGRKKAFTISEPRLGALPKDRDELGAPSGGVATSPVRRLKGSFEGVDDYALEEDDSAASASDSENESSSAGERSTRPPSHTIAATTRRSDGLPPALRNSSDGASSDGETPSINGNEQRKARHTDAPPVKGVIPRARRRKSTDLTPIVLGQARERKDSRASPGGEPATATSGSSTSSSHNNNNSASGATKEKEVDNTKRDQVRNITSSAACATPPKRNNSTEWVKSPSRATASERGLSSYSSAGTTMSSSPPTSSPLSTSSGTLSSTSSLHVSTPDSRRRRKSDATSMGGTMRETTRKKGKKKQVQLQPDELQLQPEPPLPLHSPSPSPSPSPSASASASPSGGALPQLSVDPPPKEGSSGGKTVGKKLRSLRHSFGRRDQQQELQKETATWSSATNLSPSAWESGSGQIATRSGEPALGRSGSDIQRSSSKRDRPSLGEWEL